VSQRTRILIGLVVLGLIVGAVLGVDALQRSFARTEGAADELTLVPGSVPIYLDGRIAGTFVPEQLEQLEQASFVDAEEGKTQEGPRLADVLLLHIVADQLRPDTIVVVRSSSRDKAAELTWGEVEYSDNKVQFDVSGRGALKLVSVLQRLDVRDEWIQDVDRIDVINP
jgi:hypothetical protein